MIGRASRDSGSNLRRVVYQEPRTINPSGTTSDIPAAGEITLNLDSLLRNVYSQNAAITLARTRAEEAQSEECGCRHLPQLIHRPQAEDANDQSSCRGILASLGGNLSIGSAHRLAAEAKTWQRKAELAKVVIETLLDAGNTYIDLVSVRRGEAIGFELRKYQLALLKRAEDLAKSERSAAVLVASIQAELNARRALLAKLHQQGDAASAKLVYLLNSPPETKLLIQDVGLEPIDRVDATPPVAALIARAQADGPGVHELQGLLGVIEEGLS
ncbi:MAG: hypothetical protein ACRD36_14090, partial [Candidatus Acidiferrum sp.]